MDLHQLKANGLSLHEVLHRPSRKRRTLEELLADVHESFGCLPAPAVGELSRLCNCTTDEVRRAAYVQRVQILDAGCVLNPKTRVITVCRGNSCHRADGRRILDTVKEVLGCQPGDATRDGRFQLECAECLDYCEAGPAMAVDREVHTELTPKEVRRILAQIR
ncbi:MAG: NAD(P)H-dependent oxidoreductase subunit E [Planctomycetes bacterium]|nr:NAD(P)H-dependent oxidoreductase subunit E [Planctomycetota bacterium]